MNLKPTSYDSAGYSFYAQATVLKDTDDATDETNEIINNVEVR